MRIAARRDRQCLQGHRRHVLLALGRDHTGDVRLERDVLDAHHGIRAGGVAHAPDTHAGLVGRGRGVPDSPRDPRRVTACDTRGAHDDRLSRSPDATPRRGLPARRRHAIVVPVFARV